VSKSTSAEELPAVRQLGSFVDELLSDWATPGTAVAVAKDGEVVFCQGFGQRNLADELPVTTDTVFSIASCTKAICAASLAILVDDGKLDWDEPVRTYLPDFALFDSVATDRITPRDLVTHRSGLPRHDALWYGSGLSREEMVRRLRYLEPTTDLRAVWQYQNLMYLTAGYLAGTIAGCTWEELVQRRIFEPLGMNDSAFSVTHAQQLPDHARPYLEVEGETKEIPFRNIDAIAPAGAIVSTIDDMSRWLLLNLNRGEVGGKRLISEAQMADLRTPRMVMPPTWNKYPESSLPAYALGWAVDSYRGHTTVAHGGNIDGFSSLVSLLPDDGLGVVVLTNKSSSPLPATITYTVFDRLLELPDLPWNERFKRDDAVLKAGASAGKDRASTDRVPDTTPSHPLADYAGTYEHPGYGRLLVEEKDGGLTVRFNALVGPLAHRHYDVFEHEFKQAGVIYPLTFAGDAVGDIVSVAVPVEPMVKDIIFAKQPPPAMLDERFLERLLGIYDFNGQPLTISWKDRSTLQVAMPGMPVAALAPRRGTEFRVEDRSGFRLEFALEESGPATRLVLITPSGVFTVPRQASNAGETQSRRTARRQERGGAG
jgi:CubicO group peptidase (beta-lactamase class C family)